MSDEEPKTVDPQEEDPQETGSVELAEPTEW